MAKATPDIGTTITQGYSRGIDRLGPWAPALIVIAVVSGLVAGVAAQIQSSIAPDVEEILKSAFSGNPTGIDDSDLRNVTLLGAVAGAINMLIGWGAYATFGGRLHRERHGEAADAPTPASVIGEVVGNIGKLMPKLGILIGLIVVAQVAGVLLGGIGALLGFLAWIALIYVAIRWVYAAVIAGSGEATGDAAFSRSESAVEGCWWRTFGCFIVIGLATAIPVGIAAVIVQAVLPGAFLGAFGGAIVSTMLGIPILASAFESAWSQVEGPAAGPGDPNAVPEATQPAPPAEEPGASGPFV